jgi:alkanesulfonate monooxygenase SsuD/methylene tetrahydromethanopterin reductase-like flavin-dependent oxidoreductase (luciferase family)
VRIGLGVLLLPFYNPLRLAEEVAVVDLLSEGRLDVGLGRGYNPMEFNAFSVPMDESRRRFTETLDVLRQAWTLDAVNHYGEFHRVENVRVFPRPYQKPHPPLWVGTTSRETVDICGAWGIPFMSDPAQTFEEAASLVARWTASSLAAGHDPAGAELIALRPLWVAGTLGEALADRPVWVPHSLEEALADVGRRAAQDPFDASKDSPHGTTAATDVSPRASPTSIEAGRDLHEEISRNNRYIVGDPEMVLRKLKAYRDVGYNHIVGVFNSGTRLPLEKVRSSMELFSREVLPAVRNL